MSKFLTILEVSQKQAYIFSNKKVKNNIINSAVIAHVLSPEYITEVLGAMGYSDAKNMVYSGGGHTILEFEKRETAVELTSVLTKNIYEKYDGLEVFAKTIEYDEKLSPNANMKQLTKELEKKKAIRASVFKQGSFGIEKIDSDTLSIKALETDGMNYADDDTVSEIKDKIWHNEIAEGKRSGFVPKEYSAVSKFGELGGSKNESNFIAVVHIDGNGMGKRVENIYQQLGDATWDVTKKRLREFSESIDKDFKAAYKEMADEVAANIENKTLKDLALKGNNFPVRRIITAGDDICFVAEGRIGIECARIFLEKLADKNRKNSADGQNYASCAGVALVHQKYPFYKAYELAEMLCSNAKKFCAKLSPADNGSSISAIDWHIEYGEVKDSLEEIRREYKANDGCKLELRPYIVDAPAEIINSNNNVIRLYKNFRKTILGIIAKEDNFGNGKIKELRNELKKGEVASRNYLTFNKMKGLLSSYNPKGDIKEADLLQLFTGQCQEINAFIECGEECKRSYLFDAIELMDTYIGLKEDSKA